MRKYSIPEPATEFGMYMKKSFFFFSILFLLMGCMPHSVDTSAPKETETIAVPALTAPVTTTSTMDIQTPPAEGCIQLTLDKDHGVTSDGFLIARNSKVDYLFLNIKSKKTTGIGPHNETIYGYIVSPNKKLMFTDACLGDHCYYILRTIDQVVNTFPTHNDWYPWGWLDNERIIILTRLEPHDVVILNPFTGTETTIHLDLSNPHINIQTDTESLIPTSLDSSLERVFYYDEKNGGRLVLWDINNRKEISTLAFVVPADETVGYGLASGWSPNGKKLVTVSPNNHNDIPNELYELDVDGNVVQLSKFNQKYQFANVSVPAWNPDGRNIGFFLRFGNAPVTNWHDLEQRLAILDTETLAVKSYCLPEKITFLPASWITWSPDGQQLAVTAKLSNGKVKPILIDVVRKVISIIETPQNMVVEDWMAP
ncbi:MAG: PD40 domain-containing protein [Chloroflexi bacterium]|nr:PD40 domain-containing protein [Chloroflexota bacterium]